ncbi:FAD binding domain-containing protein [Fonticella tunisiensis]|uniref:CO/xanthine dehydrogenase FAD-binding subunit n=1 Tax=Fonticella tunisiensis TaxID=1096341 RepID=A0A4R7KU44_9CLOT|nr:FAD binding domain-containing protein [Fonticella tunisiensis]TDT63668.1 CO/xanthine dehydrogenase FAD-binding subunit [Fonticella tunisiensis]
MVKVYRPSNLKEALEIISSEKCTLFAGGTDLMVKGKSWSGLEPSFDRPVVFISDLDELRKIKINEFFLTIGGACTFTRIIDNSQIPDFIKEAFIMIASPGIRNMATIGGNICNSSPAGDCLPLLYAMDASVVLESIYGRREVNIEDFILGPGKNVIGWNEILTEVRIPTKNFKIRAYRKVGTRKSTALSKVSFAGLAEIEGEELKDIRFAFGAVGPTVVRSRRIEKKIVEMVSEKKLEVGEIKKMYGSIIKPIDDQRSTANYRREVCLRFVENFLMSCKWR